MAVALRAYQQALEFDNEFYALSQVASANAGAIYLRANQDSASRTSWDDAYKLHNPFHAHLINQSKKDEARQYISGKSAKAFLELANSGQVPSWVVRQAPLTIIEDAV